MNDFTKEELQIIYLSIPEKYYPGLKNKLQSMIDNYCDNKNIQTIATGELLFHNKLAASGIIPVINKHFNLCDNKDESKCFRIDWQIYYGDK